MRKRAVITLALCSMLFAAVGCSKGTERGKQPPVKEPAAMVPAADGTPIELLYVPEGFPLGLSVSQGFALHLFETPGGSQGFKTLPPDSGHKRYYDEFTIAGHSHLLITEESTPPRFYFDENRNGDLTDDRGPFTAEKEGLLPNNVTIQIRYDAEKVVAPYRMWLFGSPMGGVRFYPVCHWRGELTINGSSYPLVAFDGNADGDYSNDPLVIDANGNGRADDGEQLRPGGQITIDGELVKLAAVSPSGLTARLLR
uniref:Lipoprotein n=1 Tax=Geobacter metallireducens TaxID=28232 RepID=A0A831XEU2_GEOME